MPDTKRISKEDQAGLPKFQNQEEAIGYFEKTYGEKFVFEESIETEEGNCHFYRLITDEEAYIKGITELNTNGHVGLAFMDSYQPVQIRENGDIQIAH